MAGTMSRMYIGTSGLQANQYALNTTSHNLANINTTGYSRQQVLLTDSVYQKLNISEMGNNQTGTGTRYSASRQLRDELLDRQYRAENGRQAYYSTMYENIYEVRDYFGELEGSTFQNCMEDIWSALEELAKDTNSVVNRSTLVAYAGNYISKAEEIYQSLVTYQENLNTEIEEQIHKINDLAQKIYDINKEIVKVEGANIEKANDYKDQRNAYLDELSAIIDIDIHENADHSIDVFAENRSLVSSGAVFIIEAQPVTEGSRFLKPVWKDDQSDVIDATKIPSGVNKSDIGSLKALLMSRGYEVPNYTSIPVDGTAQEIETYNTTIEPYSLTNIIAQFDQLIHGMVTAINDKLCPNVTVTDDAGNTYQILNTRYEGLSDEDAEAIGLTYAAGVGMGAGNQYAGTELFTRSGYDRYTEQTITVNGNTVTVKVYNAEDTNKYESMYALGNLQINDELVKNPSLLPLSMEDGAENQAIVQDLLKLWDEDFTKLNPNTLVTETFDSYYSAMIDDFANRAYTYNSVAQSAEQALKQYSDSRQQQLGVSSEEELTNLIKFQQAYNASSRYITVVSEMIEHIIEKLGS